MPDPESSAESLPADSAVPDSDSVDMEELLRLAEAMVFAATTPVTARQLGQLLPNGADSDAVLAALQARYAGRGVELVEVGGGWQFRTAPDLAPKLRRVVQVPRRLPRVAMETLAVIAWHQPVTRGEVEEIRGAGLSQATLEALLEHGLIAPKGHKEVPGRPTLWGTTGKFLEQFGLKSLKDLPRREELVSAEAAAPLLSAVADPAGDAGGDGAGAEDAEQAAAPSDDRGEGEVQPEAPAESDDTAR